jgi:hypothetical protein
MKQVDKSFLCAIPGALLGIAITALVAYNYGTKYLVLAMFSIVVFGFLSAMILPAFIDNKSPAFPPRPAFKLSMWSIVGWVIIVLFGFLWYAFYIEGLDFNIQGGFGIFVGTLILLISATNA